MPTEPLKLKTFHPPQLPCINSSHHNECLVAERLQLKKNRKISDVNSTISSPVTNDMGQKPSHFTVKLNKTKLPLSLVLRTEGRTTHNPNPEQPIKFQYKTKRKETKGAENNNKTVVLNNLNVVKSNNLNEAKCRIITTQNAPVRTKSEPSLVADRNRERHRRKKKSARLRSGRNLEQFGYEIGDVDAFLSKVSTCTSN